MRKMSLRKLKRQCDKDAVELIKFLGTSTPIVIEKIPFWQRENKNIKYRIFWETHKPSIGHSNILCILNSEQIEFYVRQMNRIEDRIYFIEPWSPPFEEIVHFRKKE